MEGEITLKLVFDGDIRRISLAAPPSISDLRKIVGEVYLAQLHPSQDFVMKWLDDEGDWISLMTDREIREAWNFAKVKANSLLRVSINPVEAKKVSFPTSSPITTPSTGTSEDKKTAEPVVPTSEPTPVPLAPAHLIPSAPPFPAPKKPAYEEQPPSPPSAPSPISFPLKSVVHHAWCDSCQARIVGRRYKCTTCHDYDLCEKCYPSYLSIHGDHKFMEVFLLPHSVEPNPKTIRGRLDAVFVGDVTIPDGQNVVASSQFVKIWRLQNKGQIKWPENTRLERVQGDVMSVEDSVPVPLADVGESVEVSVSMFAPSKPGRYTSQWRLTSPTGRRFGHLIWVVIEVVPPPSGTQGNNADEPVKISSSSNEVASEDEESEEKEPVPLILGKKVDDDVEEGPWKDQLIQLFHMGFTDRARTRQLFVKHRGDLQAVLTELLMQ
jgi:hypothetical protein